MTNNRRPTPAQLRAARGLLGWSQAELAAAAGLSAITVKKLEAAPDLAPVRGLPRTVEALLQAFQAAGVVFTWRGDRIGAERQLPDTSAGAAEVQSGAGKAPPEAAHPKRRRPIDAN